jgi:hypothetical protein
VDDGGRAGSRSAGEDIGSAIKRSEEARPLTPIFRSNNKCSYSDRFRYSATAS